MAAVDYLLELEGVVGDSVDAKHKGAIDVLSWSWGAENRAVSSGSGSGSGKAQFQDFRFVMRTSQASPKILIGLAQGLHFKFAQLIGRLAGKTQLEFLKIKFEDVLLTAYQPAASDGEAPAEEVAFSFTKFNLSITPQKADGTAGTVASGGWDVKQNKKI